MQETMHALAPALNRREILKAGLVGFLGVLPIGYFAAPARADGFNLPKDGPYSISFVNQHTGESFSGVYRVGGKYLPEAFDKINVVLRDFRTGDVFPIDPRVIDIIYAVHQRSSAKKPFEVLSGYRSPQTNSMLRRTHAGVAVNSLHLTGQAIDVRLPDIRISRLRDAAQKLQAGGVGYYPVSNFVHMDTGEVRHWTQDPNNT
ncbi:MAG TPA: DUF882 domain-containing protein [Patescibacteria group bacterium]|jgi:uncharacterized protein YcbK (DUF882 family)|nr:DUF882 domain-containing protein [Patescibacteria group bacterium]